MKDKKNIYQIVGAVVVIVVIILFVSWKGASQNKNNTVVTGSSSLPGIQTTTAPWVAEISKLKERLSDIGLPALSAEGTALHIHQHLDIFIDGKTVPVPPGIGINVMAGFISPIHTHDTSAVIHVESPTIQNFTLGQFFDIWGVNFTKDSIGGYSNQDGKTLQVFVNGVAYTDDPRNIVLDAHQEIVIAYGSSSELPNPIPSSYAFPEGE